MAVIQKHHVEDGVWLLLLRCVVATYKTSTQSHKDNSQQIPVKAPSRGDATILPLVHTCCPVALVLTSGDPQTPVRERTVAQQANFALAVLLSLTRQCGPDAMLVMHLL